MDKRLKRLLFLFVSLFLLAGIFLIVLTGCSNSFVSAEKKWDKATEKSAVTNIDLSAVNINAGSNLVIVKNASAKAVLERSYKRNDDGSVDAWIELNVKNIVIDGMIGSFMKISKDAAIKVKMKYNTATTKMLYEAHGYNFDGEADTNPENKVDSMVLGGLEGKILDKNGEAKGLKPFVDLINSEIDSLHIYKFDKIKKTSKISGGSKGAFTAISDGGIVAILNMMKAVIANAGYLQMPINGKEYTLDELIKKVAGSQNIVDYLTQLVGLGDVEVKLYEKSTRLTTTQAIGGHIDKKKINELLQVAYELFPGQFDDFASIIDAATKNGINISMKLATDTKLDLKKANTFELVVTV